MDKTKIEVWVAILYLVVSIQTVSLISISEDAGLKIFHIIFPVLFFLFVKKIVFIRSSAPVYFFLLFVIFSSLINYLLWGFNFLIVNYVFCLMLFVVGSSLSKEWEYTRCLNGLKAAAIGIILYEIVLIFLNFSEVKQAQAASVALGVRPETDFLVYGGGLNLEVTWLALATLFFIKSPTLYFIYFALVAFVDFYFLSRTGLILLLFSLFVYFRENSSLKKRTVIKLIIYSSILIPIFVVMTLKLYSDSAIFERFQNIGNEPGSMGRIELWSYSAKAFIEWPFAGYGAGNSINIIRGLGFESREGNVHNYFIQVLLDFGLLGLLTWLSVIWGLSKNRRYSELYWYVMAFVLASMVQFRGAEPVFYFVISILAGASYFEKRKRKPQL